MVHGQRLGDLKEADQLEPVQTLGAGLIGMDLRQPGVHGRVGGDQAVDVREAEEPAQAIVGHVDDAVGLIQMLTDDQRFSKVIVLGHSEGALIGMLACRDQPVKAYISVAGAGDRADKIITDQLKSQPQFIQDGFKTLTDSLKKGKTIDNIDPALYFIARPSIQKYLLSWFRYEPTKVIKIVKVPTLIIQGNTDLQVKVTDADRLKKGKSDATEIIIPNMNHVLKDAPADKDQNMATYSKPDLPLKAELVPDIVAFINKSPL